MAEAPVLRVAKGAPVFGDVVGHWRALLAVLGVLTAMVGYWWLSRRAA